MKARIESFMEAFGMSEYPVLFRYADDLPKGTLFPPEGARTCLFALLAKTRTEGMPVALSPSHHGCPGGRAVPQDAGTGPRPVRPGAGPPRAEEIRAVHPVRHAALRGRSRSCRLLRNPGPPRGPPLPGLLRPGGGCRDRPVLLRLRRHRHPASYGRCPVRPEGRDGSFRPFGPSLRGEEPADLRRAVRAVHKDGGEHPGELPHDKDLGDDPEADPGI